MTAPLPVEIPDSLRRGSGRPKNAPGSKSRKKAKSTTNDVLGTGTQFGNNPHVYSPAPSSRFLQLLT
jgi:hypothetical protein